MKSIMKIFAFFLGALFLIFIGDSMARRNKGRDGEDMLIPVRVGGTRAFVPCGTYDLVKFTRPPSEHGMHEYMFTDGDRVYVTNDSSARTTNGGRRMMLSHPVIRRSRPSRVTFRADQADTEPSSVHVSVTLS